MLLGFEILTEININILLLSYKAYKLIKAEEL